MEMCELEEFCETKAELQCVTKEVQICSDVQEDPKEDITEESEKEEGDGPGCPGVAQPVCSLVDVERCSERPLCREMVRTVRREICPDSEKN